MFVHYFLLYLVRFHEEVFAAPLLVQSCDSSADTSGHDARSIWNIIWSCVTTIIACTWVAVHPNMPKPGATFFENLLNRLRIMVWMMIAPELVIFWAVRQWLGAKKLKAKYHEKHPNWKMSHGYFIQMGGFMLYDKEGLTPLGVLTEERLDELLNENKIQFPQITREEIQDRSKRDTLSKTVAVGQTFWFVAQCITRRAQQLNTTELELITVAFALLNTFIYYFWWGKPMDVQTTVPVYLLVTESIPDAEKEKPAGSRPNSLATPAEDSSVTGIGNIAEIKNTSPSFWTPISSAFLFVAGAAIKLVSNLCFMLPKKGLEALFRRLGDMTAFSTARHIGAQDKRVPRFHASNCSHSDRNRIVALVSAIGMIFGAVHCVAWNFIFPSHAELLIWRVSSAIITVVPLAMAFSACMIALVRTDEYNEPVGRLDICVAVVGFCGFLVGFLGILPYILARLLLLVEAFASLRDLPSSALLEVRWTSFLPHL